MLSAVAPAAAADTLPGRDSPFTPSQAVADQYLSPAANPRQASPSGVRPPTVAGDERAAGRGVAGDAIERGVAGDAVAGPPVAGQAPALVERGATAPSRPGGTLPFTGSDLLTLVWLALALVAAGIVVEVARRRLEAVRARAGVS